VNILLQQPSDRAILLFRTQGSRVRFPLATGLAMYGFLLRHSCFWS